MKLTMQDILETVQPLSMIGNNDTGSTQPFIVADKISQFQDNVAPHVKRYRNTLDAMVRKYGSVKEGSNAPTIDKNVDSKEMVDAFEREIQPIIDQEIDLPDIEPLKSIDFGNYNPGANILTQLRRIGLYK